ncbi:MAG TPA: class I SAM-dependent methyltransferase [Stellaceae bacterium]|nr:class I SAM-dependent methyltransferase [Stellaceae bacterium]
MKIPFNIDAGDLMSRGSSAEYFSALYSKYQSELVELTRELAPLRERMLAEGYGADFGDMEAEILYMLLREARPDKIAEISPCHGYSTNYILAALTRNNFGRVFSFEITKETNGKPTEVVIAENLLSRLDRSRLVLHVGDAITADIPDVDFLFIDSAHEAWFAAWYLKNLVPRTKLCFVHDIVVRDPTTTALIPKAPITGIRESFFLLHALSVAKTPIAAVADIEHGIAPALRSALTARKGFPERSVIFEGSPCGAVVSRICDAQMQLLDLRQRLLLGDRWAAILGMRDVARANPDDPFTRLCAYQVIADLGYGWRALDQDFIEAKQDVDRISSGGMPDIATFVAALELGAHLNYRPLVRDTLANHKSLGSKATAFFLPVFLEHALPFNRIGASIHRQVFRHARL